MVMERFFFFQKNYRELARKAYTCMKIHEAQHWNGGNHSGDSEGGSDIVLDTSLALNG